LGRQPEGNEKKQGMIVVDSSVWIDYFNHHPSPSAEKLKTCFADETPLAIVPMVLMEVLSGFKSETDFQKALDFMLDLPIIQTGPSVHVNSARLFRHLRQKGITMNGYGDCLIAQTCIENGALLLSVDSDFEHIARHCPLKLVH
jgi:predicted nucleic acid-binding protein